MRLRWSVSKAKPIDRPDRGGHVALAGEARAHPVAERRRLGHAALDVAERQAAEQRFAVGREDEEGIARAVPDLALVAPDAAAEGELVRSSAGQIGSHGARNARLSSRSFAHCG